MNAEHRATKLLPVGKVFANDWNPNVMDEETYLALKAGIQRGGFVQPILVRPLPGGGRYEILDGEHRWKAVKEAGFETIPAVVVEDEDASAKLRTLQMNRVRGEMPDESIGKLLAEISGDVDDQAIMELLAYDDKELDWLVSMAEVVTEPSDEPSGQSGPDSETKFVRLSYDVPETAAEVIRVAIEHVRAESECEPGIALERICADYLAGARKGE